MPPCEPVFQVIELGRDGENLEKRVGSKVLYLEKVSYTIWVFLMYYLLWVFFMYRGPYTIWVFFM